MPVSKSEQGFTLLEVMVAVLVLAIGLLGLAQLQVTSLKQNERAHLRSQASILAADMFDRMRANQSAAQEGKYNLTLSATAVASPSTVAESDIFEWLSNITTFLPPDSDGAITCTDSDATDSDACSQGSIYTVTLQWLEAQDDGSRGTSSFTYSGAL